MFGFYNDSLLNRSGLKHWFVIGGKILFFFPLLFDSVWAAVFLVCLFESDF